MRRNPSFSRKPTKGKPFRQLKDANAYDHAWQAFARRYLRKHPICSCSEVRVWRAGAEELMVLGPAGAVAPAVHVDHVRPLRMGGAKYDPANLQPLCHACHSRKTAKWG